MLHFLWSNYALCNKSFEFYEYSNLEIAKWAEYYLSQKISFHQSCWLAGKVTESPDDILLGHPTWDGRSQKHKNKQGELTRNWVKDNSLSLFEECHPNTYILMPWVPDFPSIWIDNMPHYRSQLLAAKKIFALCGEIWIERTLEKNDDSIQFLVKDKLVHFNLGVAYQNFPIKKEKFNHIGERQLLDTIDYAKKEFTTEKTEFYATNLEHWNYSGKIDMLISVETIEHIVDTSLMPKFVNRNAINHLVLTYPSKKTSHYNEFHHHDFNIAMILEIFSDFTCYRHFNWEYEFDVVFLLRRR
jgi:hypothetical protein